MNRQPRGLGEWGADFVSAATAQTVADGFVWVGLESMWSVTVIATLTELGRTAAAGTVSLFANGIIYGTFTNFTLTSGAVRAYKMRVGGNGS